MYRKRGWASMKGRAMAGALLTLVLAGCLGVDVAPTLSEPDDGPVEKALRFREGVLLTNTAGYGYEPSIKIGPEGNLYVAAATGVLPNADRRWASAVWYSTNDGASWTVLPLGPNDALSSLPGFEGDLAVDAKGRVYFADIHLADVLLSRWSVGPLRAPVWDWTRPALPTLNALDDRPYLAAHGDGIVYLVTNNGVAPHGWQNLLRDPGDATGPGARIWVFASEDAGLTWSLGWGFPGETFCAPAASPTDDHVVIVACHGGDGGPGSDLRVYRSADRARTFQSAWVTNYTNGPSFLTPWPAVDAGGWEYASWLDDHIAWSGVNTATWDGASPGRVLLARSPDGKAWERLDVTPFAGRFGMNHVSAGPAGVVAITFHATQDVTPDAGSTWYGYALVTADGTAAAPSWRLALLDANPSAYGPVPPRDFFQNAVGADGRVHVAFQKMARGSERDDVYYVGQIAERLADGLRG